MTKTDPVRCAIIGLGRIASTLEDDALREKPASHAGAITSNPATELVGGCDEDPSARAAFAARWDVEGVYSDPRSMIRELQPGILHITTHEDSHLDYLQLAVEEKIPVVVLEKPVSDSLRRARHMARSLRAGGGPTVLVNHERRYSLDYVAVREAVATRRFGTLHSVSGRLYMGFRRPLRDILIHDGTHLLDIIPFLTGEPLENLRVIPASGSQKNIYVTARCRGVDVLIEAGNRRDHLVFELELSFEKGRIRVGNGVFEFWDSVESPYYENFRSLSLLTGERAGATGYFSRMMDDAVRVYHSPGSRPLSSLDDGVESLALVMAIRRKLRRG